MPYSTIKAEMDELSRMLEVLLVMKRDFIRLSCKQHWWWRMLRKFNVVRSYSNEELCSLVTAYNYVGNRWRELLDVSEQQPRPVSTLEAFIKADTKNGVYRNYPDWTENIEFWLSEHSKCHKGSYARC